MRGCCASCRARRRRLTAPSTPSMTATASPLGDTAASCAWRGRWPTSRRATRCSPTTSTRPPRSGSTTSRSQWRHERARIIRRPRRLQRWPAARACRSAGRGEPDPRRGPPSPPGVPTRRSAVSFAACDECLRRTALIAALAPWLDIEWRRRSAPSAVLSLPDAALIALDRSGRAARAHAAFSPAGARERIAAARLTAACRCSDGYPDRLRELADPPAVLHVAGRPEALERTDCVAIVGARRGTFYGLEVSRTLGRGLAAAGVPVVSGMAMGVDSAAHVGALEYAAAGPPAVASSDPACRATGMVGGGPAAAGAHEHGAFGPVSGAIERDAGEHVALRPAAPVAVLAGGADVAYPPSRRRLHARLVERGCVVSELPPGFTAYRWCFVARNRLIAGLAALTVVVEATERSGSLTTADFAAQLGRPVAAVPGPITSRFSAGTNMLLASGAGVVRDTRDVLDQLLGPSAPAPEDLPPPIPIEPRLRRLLDAIERGAGSLAELTSDPEATREVLQDLTDLELRGLVRREFGGRYVRALEERR